MSLSTAAANTTAEPARRFQARRVGAAFAVAGFLGASLAAPLTFSSAFAAEGGALNFPTSAAQELTSVSGVERAIDLGTSEAAEISSEGFVPNGAEYSLNDFLFRGAISWGGYKFTFYSQQVLPGGGLDIPGRHVNAGGYVSDSDGYIVLAGSAPKGTIYDTPFGYQGKIYDRGTVGTHLDVYIR